MLCVFVCRDTRAHFLSPNLIVFSEFAWSVIGPLLRPLRKLVVSLRELPGIFSVVNVDKFHVKRRASIGNARHGIKSINDKEISRAR